MSAAAAAYPTVAKDIPQGPKPNHLFQVFAASAVAESRGRKILTLKKEEPWPHWPWLLFVSPEILRD
jgi:hypothetical protein